MKKKYVTSLLAALLIVVLCLTGCGKSAGQLADESRSGVVRILVMDREGNGCFISGFGVGEAGEPTQWFVTTALGLDDFGEDTRMWIAEDDITFGDGDVDTSVLIPCKIMEQSDILTLIKSEKVPEGRVALPLSMSDRDVAPGDRAFALGYAPLKEPLGSAGAVPASMEACGITESIVDRRTKSSAFPHLEVIRHSGSFFSGYAGGPLIDEKGEVIGVVMAASDQPNESISLDVEHVKELLEIYTFYGEKETGPAAIGWIVALTLIVAAAVLFFLRKDIWIQVMILSCKLQEKRGKACAKKSGPPSCSDPIPGPIPVERSARYILVCLGGRFEGKRFYLSQIISIGRNPNWCELVIPKDVGLGICGRHCCLLSDNTRLWLKNVEYSTTLYGPSLEERRMLKVNEVVELHPGDMIWLGNGKNWFVIESNPSFIGPIM